MLLTDLRGGPLGLFRFLSAFQFMAPRLYQETITADAQSLGTRFEIPFVLIQGESDLQTLTSLAARYFDAIEAPRKRLSLLAGGGHLSVLLQPGRFLEELETALA